ncbi:MAG TPA: ATP-binding protein [Solirubrobacteraceae bacterium]
MTWPRPTIRLRLTAWYAGIFLLLGAGLLVVSYAVVRDNFDRAQTQRHVEVESTLRNQRAANAPRVRVRVSPGLPSPTAPEVQQLSEREREVYTRARDALLSADRRADDDAKRRVLLYFLAALFGVVVLSVGAGWLVAGRVLRPVAQITATARRISDRTLDERINLDGPRDELRELADTFDSMLGRLDGAFATQRRFVADASHELRTPLTIVRTEIDVTLADPDADVADLREMAGVVRAANERMERLIDALLALATSGAGALDRRSTDLARTVRVALERGAPVPPDLHLDAELDPAPIDGDQVLLERLAANLVENAVRYNAPNGWIRIRTRVAPGGRECELVVANSGPRLTPEQATTIFEPFRRLDPSRSRATGGFGLGLAVVRAVAEAHGGRVRAEPLPDGGLAVAVCLPHVQGDMKASGTPAPASERTVAMRRPG